MELLPADEEEIYVNIYRGDKWRSWFDGKDELGQRRLSGFRYNLVRLCDLVAQYRRYVEREGSYAGDRSGHNPLSDAAKLVFMSDDTERSRELERVIVAKYGKRTELAFSSACCLGVCPLGAMKGNAVQELVGQLPSDGVQVVLAECIVFGDGMNGLRMLQLAGEGGEKFTNFLS
ncbi:hydrolase [Trypanosoma rangeli]|uniref:Hydrolase n=1 Tax=Trypanosoma rangeli TaxID=5698 RepID=A0A422MVP9_TRYRA|nr:hydrolase [Trypanosoma rangeli]RNE97312.1 hydrolase [Trypanosoma rangeli]|eukprot:RNE97312.1 hydrolase [Trypanosoma rangeli]